MADPNTETRLRPHRLHWPTIACLAVIFVVSFWLLLRNISQPWNGIDGDDGALFSAVAHNYLRYGFVPLRFGQASNFEPVQNLSEIHYYYHHPPLLPLLVTGSFALFGESEAAARLVPIVATLGSIVVFFLLAVRILGTDQALLATIYFVLLPATLFLGRKPGYEAPTLFFILLILLCYLRFLESPGGGRLILLFTVVCLGLLTDWPAYYCVPVLTVHSFLEGRGTAYRLTLCLPALAGGIFALTFFSFWLIAPDEFLSVFLQAGAYMGFIEPTSPLASRYVEAAITFTSTEYMRRIALNFDKLFAYPIMLLAIFGAVGLLHNRAKEFGVVVATLSVVATLNLVLFWRSAFFHIWWLYYFAPAFALLGAVGTGAILAGSVRHARTWPRFGMAFFVGLSIADCIPRLLAMHGEQSRLLSPGSFEAAALIKHLGMEVKERSNPDDIVATNLQQEGSRRLLEYYAQRQVLPEIRSISDLEKVLAQSNTRGTVRFLYWAQPAMTVSDESLVSILLSKGAPLNFSVDGQHFTWFDRISALGNASTQRPF